MNNNLKFVFIQHLIQLTSLTAFLTNILKKLIEKIIIMLIIL